MAFGRELKRRVRAVVAPVIFLALVGYFGWNATQNGYVFAYIGVIIVVMQGGLVGRLVKRWGERPLLIGGLALLSVGLILLPFSASVGMETAIVRYHADNVSGVPLYRSVGFQTRYEVTEYRKPMTAGA